MGTLKHHMEVCYKKMDEPVYEQGTYCAVLWDDVMCWEHTLGGTVAKQRCPDYFPELNSTGYATRECLPDGTWKPSLEFNTTNGWTNYSGCMGNHNHHTPTLDVSEHVSRIQLMSEIGYGISLASLIVAVLIMICSKRLHCKSNSLHINLFISFILRASLSFIKNIFLVNGIGLEKDIIRSSSEGIQFRTEGSHWECRLLVTVFFYTVSASLMWIFMEGLYLHMLVYRTLFTERHGIRFYVLLGWLSPFIYIIPWVFVRIFKENERCWIPDVNKPDSYLWIIKAPIILTVLINFVFFIDIVRVLCVRVKSHRHAKGTSQHFRKIAKFAVVLIPLFGVIYIVTAAFPQGVSIEADMVYLYCEMFYNSFQGFILALLFCFLNEEVHNEIRRCWYRRRFDGFNTRTVFLSSWRKSSNISRSAISRDHHMTEVLTDTHKSNEHSGKYMLWKSSKPSGHLTDQRATSFVNNDYNKVGFDSEM